MNRNHCLFLFAALVACGPATSSQYKGEPLAHAAGEMALASGVTVSSPVHLAVVWFPTAAPTAGMPPKGVVTSEIQYQGQFPQSFSFDFFEVPPAEALGTVPDAGVTYALGTLVAYEDLDGDGQLTIAHGTPVTDKVLAASAQLYDLEGLGYPVDKEQVSVIYASAPLQAPDAGIPAGYSLERFTIHANLSDDFAFEAIDTPISLVLQNDPKLSLAACADAYDYTITASTLCGIRLNTQPTVIGGGSLDSMGAATFFAEVLPSLNDTMHPITNATVTLNGTAIPFDSTSMSYSLTETTPMVIKTTGTNTVHVEAPGFDPLDSTFSIPGAVHITSPADGSDVHVGSQVTLTWTAAQGASNYLPVVPGVTQAAMLSTDTSYTFTVPDMTGPLYVEVLAEGPVMLPFSVTGSSSAMATYQVVP